MTNRKTTKRALFTSTLALLMCVAMLIGTTFAWFTDTASTNVNKVQAGTLKVALEMQKADNEWETAVGKTLDFIKDADATKNEAILWEPGCTYELPALRVVNKGNLALKYKVVISGIKGDAKLNEAIDWTIDYSGTASTTAITNTNNSDETPAVGDERSLGVNESHEFTISGTMKTTAGNEYQGLSIDGIAITVVATQDTVEYDSNDNQYDKDAVVVYHYYAGNDNYPYTFASFGCDTLTSTVVDSNHSWDNLCSENGYSANGHNVISLCQNTGDEAAFTDCIFLCDVGNVYSAEHGKLTFKDCTFYGWVHFGNPTDATILFENCTFTSSSDVKIGGSADSVTFRNCTFEEKQTIVDTATMNAKYSYAGECGRIMLWSDTTFENCTVAREVYKGENVTVTGELPTLVSTAEELKAALTPKGQNGDLGTIILTDCITVENWTAVGANYTSFVLDGNGHSIYGLTDALVSTIGPSCNVTFKNLTLKNVAISNNSTTDTEATVGALINCVNSEGGNVDLTIDNCHVDGGSIYGWKYAGGFVGMIGGGSNNSVEIKNSTVNNVEISTTDSSCGGFVAHTHSNLTLTNCAVSGNTSVKCSEDRNSGAAKAGWFVGTVNKNTTTITSCTVSAPATNLSNANATAPLNGGFVGRNAGGTLTVN